MLALNNSRVVVYGKRLTCPLYSSIPSEARKVIAGYRRAILLKFRSCQECGEQRAISSFSIFYLFIYDVTKSSIEDIMIHHAV